MSASSPSSKRGSVFLLAAAIVVLCVLLVGITLTALTYTTMTADLREATRERALATTELIARQAGGALQFGRAEPLEDLISSSLAAAPDQVVGAVGHAIASGQDMAASGAVSPELRAIVQRAAETGEAAFSPEAFTVAIPTLFGPDAAVVGAVGMEWSPEADLRAATERMAGHVGISIGVMVIATLLAVGWFRHALSRPLLHLAAAMDDIGRGDLAREIPARRRGDEIGRIAANLEGLRDRLSEGETLRRAAAFRGAAFDSASSALLVIDDDLRVVYANAAYLALLERLAATFKTFLPDFDPSTVVGSNLSDWHPGETGFEDLLRDTAAMPRTIDMKIGETRLRLGLAAVRDAQGHVSGVVAEFADVTAQTMDSAVLKAIEASQAVAEFAPDGTLARANASFSSALGDVRDSALAGADLSTLLSPDGDGAELALRDRLDRGETVSGRIRAIRDGSESLFDGSLFRVADANGVTMRYVLIARDITQSEAQIVEAAAARDALQADQAAVVEALSMALARVSDGDLTVRLEQSFAPDYEALRSNFNDAVGNLCQLVGSVSELATSVRKEAIEIASSADSLSQRTERTAATLEQTAAALDELTSSVHSASEGADRANGVVSDARSHALLSGEVVREAVEAMSEIEASAGKIAKIIDVIEDIAFQTNLLALNAGVEAARAGEAGRGFAVVASEVRALAQRSSDAAREINDLITSSDMQVKRGVDLVGRAGEALQQIVESVGQISDLVGAIAASSKEQATGVSEINTAVNQLDQATQQNAAMFEETTAASHALTQVAENLNDTVARFDTGYAPAPSRAPRSSSGPSSSSAPHVAVPAAGSSRRSAPVASTRRSDPQATSAATASGSAAALLQAPDLRDEGWEEF